MEALHSKIEPIPSSREMAVSHRLLFLKWVYPGMLKKGVSGTLGRRAWKRPFWLSLKGFGLVRPSLPSRGPIHQEECDEDLLFCFALP